MIKNDLVSRRPTPPLRGCPSQSLLSPTPIPPPPSPSKYRQMEYSVVHENNICNRFRSLLTSSDAPLRPLTRAKFLQFVLKQCVSVKSFLVEMNLRLNGFWFSFTLLWEFHIWCTSISSFSLPLFAVFCYKSRYGGLLSVRWVSDIRCNWVSIFNNKVNITPNREPRDEVLSLNFHLDRWMLHAIWVCWHHFSS